MNYTLRAVAALILFASLTAVPVAAQDAQPDAAALAQRLADLERSVAELKAAGTLSAAEARLAEIEKRIGILAEEIDALRLAEAGNAAPTIAAAAAPSHGMAPAAAKVYAAGRGLSIGGYGEVLYENPDSQRDNGTPSGRTAQADVLRVVTYFGYKFNDKLLFNSEIELEHGSTGKGGEVSAEFAYLEYGWRPELGVRGGLLLVPVGFVNELHEPPVFLGAKRPEVERAILPSTWRESGVGLFGDSGALSYRAALTTSLDAAGFTAAGIRGGRTSGARAKAEDLALSGRLDWKPVEGAILGTSFFVGDTGQGAAAAGDPIAGRLTLADVHAEWRWRGLQLRGVWAQSQLDDAAAINVLNNLAGNRSVGSRQEGMYAEAGYDVLAHRGGRAALIPFVRWESFDTQKRVPHGFLRNPANDVESLTAGVAWRPIDQVVLKLDWQDVDNGAGTGVDQINLALGYLF